MAPNVRDIYNWQLLMLHGALPRLWFVFCCIVRWNVCARESMAKCTLNYWMFSLILGERKVPCWRQLARVISSWNSTAVVHPGTGRSIAFVSGWFRASSCAVCLTSLIGMLSHAMYAAMTGNNKDGGMNVWTSLSHRLLPWGISKSYRCVTWNCPGAHACLLMLWLIEIIRCSV